MVNLFEKERAVREYQGSVATRLWRHFRTWPPILALLAIAYAGYVFDGTRVHALEAGGALAGVHAVTKIFRDDRGVPHIRATNIHDAFFAEGYAQASDRLFQMDLFRRYIYGQLAEVLGPIQLRNDEAMRALDAHDIVARQWRELSVADRAALRAFSEGVNEAMTSQPLPLEFRLLLYKPERWSPLDSLAVTLAMTVSLEDPIENIVRRDELWRMLSKSEYNRVLPLSDDFYDVSPSGVLNTARHATPPLAMRKWAQPVYTAFGSNAWGAGADRTQTRRALIANDPHLSLSVPGIWYVVELRAPSLHVAGATVPGIPGVVLGHNEHVAWATTNAMATTFSVYRPGMLNERDWRLETFRVRFAPDVIKKYYRAANEFGVPIDANDRMLLVRWPPYAGSGSALSTAFALNRASDTRSALSVLAKYSGPPQNFVVADSKGEVAYHLAGLAINDPAWGRYIHPAADLRERFRTVRFDKLPAVPPSRSAVVLSANNKMYGSASEYRLSAMFAPPYRAFRIAQLLHARTLYDAAYFQQMQLDTISPADAEFAHRMARYGSAHRDVLPKNWVLRFSQWDGSFSPNSTTASFEHRLRVMVDGAGNSPYWTFEGIRESTMPSQMVAAIQDAVFESDRASGPWSRLGAVEVLHPFGPIGFPFLNAGTFPGDGDEYTIHVQSPALSQSFRAVWETGAWERGGISIPAGESGEPGSTHYDDQRAPWIRGELRSLPFSDAAVYKASASLLLLTPR